MRFLNNRLIFTTCVPIMAVVGAATTVAAPAMLDAADFTRFALLNSLFSYLSEFDLGLSRLSDRRLSTEEDHHRLVGSLFGTRYLIAGTLTILVILAARLLDDRLIVFAGIGGIAILVANGPLTYFRARSEINQLTLCALLTQFGLTLPRFAGLLLGGVTGCMLSLAAWEITVSAVLNWRFVRQARLGLRDAAELTGQALPLFLYGAGWIFYVFANRWISYWVSETLTEAGLFAFGANLASIAIMLIGAISQPFYPRHLMSANSRRLALELGVLLLLGIVGCMAGIVLCRFALPIVFPHFAAASAATPIILFSAIPLALCAWTIPILIARSKLTWGLISLTLCLTLMFVLMRLLGAKYGLIGQAWACMPPAVVFLALQLVFTTSIRRLVWRDAVLLWSACLVGIIINALVWVYIFGRHVSIISSMGG